MKNFSKLLSLFFIVLSNVFLPNVVCAAMVDEKTVIEYIFQESIKELLKTDANHMLSIQKFIIQKAKDYATQHKDFSENFDVDSDYLQEPRISLIQLDENNILLSLPTYLSAYQADTSFFLIQRDKISGEPMNFPTLGHNFPVAENSYEQPIFNVVSKSGYTNLYIAQFQFKDKGFNLIRKLEIELEKGSENDNQTENSAKKTKIVVKDMSKEILNIYAKLSSQNLASARESLFNYKNWEKIRLVKVSKAYFYVQPNEESKQKSYIVNGEIVLIQEIEREWLLVSYYNLKNDKITKAWIKSQDLMSINKKVESFLPNEEASRLK